MPEGLTAESDRELTGIDTIAVINGNQDEAESDRELTGIDTYMLGPYTVRPAESDRELTGIDTEGTNGYRALELNPTVN